MYGFGYLAAIVLPLLASAAPSAEPQAYAPPDESNIACCTITSKADFPEINPDPYLAVNCIKYGGIFHGTFHDDVNRVWRAECHSAPKPPTGLHEVSLTVINVDCKPGHDTCV